MESLFEEYKKILGVKEIIKDGIINEDLFTRQKYKILWLLKEPNSQNNDWDLRTYFSNPKGQYAKWKQSAGKMIEVTYGMLNDIFDYDKISSVDTISDVLSRVAVINIKKIGGNSSSKPTEIADFFHKTASVLHKQIDMINPDIIINGSRIWESYPLFKHNNYKNINSTYYCRLQKIKS